ncbi:hypothetical protein AB1N83_012849 [Pleurotus pulmonarius]
MSPRDVKQVWQYEAPGISPNDFYGNSFQSGNWEHSLDSFFRDCNSSYVWSLTQMKATEEHFDTSHQTPQPKKPRVRNPWPVLKIRKTSGEEEFLNKPDEGCIHEAKELAGPDECRCKTCLKKDDGDKSSGAEGERIEATSKDDSENNADESSSPAATPDAPIEGPPPILDAEPKIPTADGSSISTSAPQKLSEDVSPVSDPVEGDSPSDATQRRQTPEKTSNEVNTSGLDGPTHQDAHPPQDDMQPADKPPATNSEDAAQEPPSLDRPVSPCGIPLPVDSDEGTESEQTPVNRIYPASIPSASDSSADIVPPTVLKNTFCNEVESQEDANHSKAEPPTTVVGSESPLDFSLDVTSPPSPPNFERRDDCLIVGSVMESNFSTGIMELSNIDAPWNPHSTKDKNDVEIEVRAVMTPFSSNDSFSISRGDFSSDDASQATPRARTPHESQTAVNGLDTVETAPLLLSPPGSDGTQSMVNEKGSRTTPQLDNIALSAEGDVVLSEIDAQEAPSERATEVQESDDLSSLHTQEHSAPSPSPNHPILNTETGDENTNTDPSNAPIEGPTSEMMEDAASPSQSHKPHPEHATPTSAESHEPSDSKASPAVESLHAPTETAIPPLNSQDSLPAAQTDSTDGRPATSAPSDAPESSGVGVVGESVQGDATATNQSCHPKVSQSPPLFNPPPVDSTAPDNALEKPSSNVAEAQYSDKKSTETTVELPCPDVETTPKNVACDQQVESVPESATVPEPPKKEVPPWDPRLMVQQLPFHNCAELPCEEHERILRETLCQNLPFFPEVFIPRLGTTFEELREEKRARASAELPFFSEAVIPPLYKTFQELQEEQRARISAELPFFTEYMIPPLYKTYKELQSEKRARVSAELPFFQEIDLPRLYNTPNRSYFEGPQYDPLYIKDLPKLEEFIPENYLPDTLIVHDSEQATRASLSRGCKKSYIYQRQYPERPSDSKGLGKIGHIYLSYANKLGSGHWSNVYKASFKLPSPLTAANSPNGHVVVAAKVHDGGYEAKTHLKNEGKTYSRLPKRLMQDYCGYATFPHEGNPSSCRNPVPLGPVVPKFYGYYVPKDAIGSPVLLLEHCGTSLAGRNSSVAEKEEVISLYARLHNAGFLQGSAYRRNMLVQPGPLTVAPELRSMDTPSYRLIDFGRGETEYSSREEQWEYEYAVDHVFHHTDY